MLPPAAKGTSSLIGRSGQFWALAEPARPRSERTAREAPRKRRRGAWSAMVFMAAPYCGAGAVRNQVGEQWLTCMRPMMAERNRSAPAGDTGADPPTSPPESRCGCALPSAFACSAGRPSSGRRTTTVVPAPSVERMRITPPCSSISDLAMARPSPEPWWVLVSWLSTCSNGRPSFCSASRAMPMPESWMPMTTAPRDTRPRTVMRPFSGVNLTALDRRLSAICLSARRSALQTDAGGDLGGDLELLLLRARR